MKYCSLLAKFHDNPSYINGCYGRGDAHTQTNTPNVNQYPRKSLRGSTNYTLNSPMVNVYNGIRSADGFVNDFFVIVSRVTIFLRFHYTHSLQ